MEHNEKKKKKRPVTFYYTGSRTCCGSLEIQKQPHHFRVL